VSGVENGKNKEQRPNKTNVWNEPLHVPPPPPELQLQNKAPSSMLPQENTLRFRGSHNPLSNFYPTSLMVWNTTFQSTEHAYNFRKAVEMGQHTTAEKIRHAPNAFTSMQIANEVITDDRWANMKQSVMNQLLQEKAKQCDTFHIYLMNSRGKQLVEDTSHEYWGRGKTGQGLNMLGRLLMTLRDSLKDGPSQSPNHSNMVKNRRQMPRSHHFPSRGSQQLVCYNCNEKSHTQSTCRLPSPVQCHACLQYGHKRKFCENRGLHAPRGPTTQIMT
jgi:ribA/ribD-fused uncharacterized protein